jgi:hypothetical protein
MEQLVVGTNTNDMMKPIIKALYRFGVQSQGVIAASLVERDRFQKLEKTS